MRHIQIYESFIPGQPFNREDMKGLFGEPEMDTFKLDMARIKALLWIYKFQTEDERSSSTTHALNGVGFTGIDGSILSSFAKQIIDKSYLSDKQLQILRKKIVKYENQMVKITNAIQKGEMQKDPLIDEAITKWIKKNSHRYTV
jgi:hypothetical protein